MAKKCVYKSLPESEIARRRNMSFDFSYEKVIVPEFVKKFASGRTYYIHTYGCQANYRDEEVMAGYLELAGFKKGKEDNADVIILNTCAVRENAEQKVFGHIGNLKSY